MGPTITIAISTYHEYSSKENGKTNTVVYETDNFIDIFLVNFAEEKGPNFMTSYLSFNCKFEVISNFKLKSRMCSDRLPHLIFVLYHTGWSCKMKRPLLWWQRKWCCGCILVREIKSSIKFGLLQCKGSKSKWHSIQIFFNSLLTIFIHTTFRNSLQLVQNIYSLWLTHPFWHFANFAEGVWALLYPCT